MTSLVASAVTAGYGARAVLRGCDLALQSGEVVAIVGPNGAGKSTLLRCLAGLLRPTGGTVHLDGEPIGMLPRGRLARRIAVVPQIFETLFPFTVREVVGLGRVSRLGPLGTRSGADIVAVDRALVALELSGFAERRIDQLSGGERQRAVLAMALAQEADVLLLDEPTVHLDPGHQRALLVRVRELAHERGLIVVAVLHDLNLAAALADRIAVVADGRVVRDGPPVAVLERTLVAEVFGPGLVVGDRDGLPFVLPGRWL